MPETQSTPLMDYVNKVVGVLKERGVIGPDSVVGIQVDYNLSIHRPPVLSKERKNADERLYSRFLTQIRSEAWKLVERGYRGHYLEEEDRLITATGVKIEKESPHDKLPAIPVRFDVTDGGKTLGRADATWVSVYGTEKDISYSIWTGEGGGAVTFDGGTRQGAFDSGEQADDDTPFLRNLEIELSALATGQEFQESPNHNPV